MQFDQLSVREPCAMPLSLFLTRYALWRAPELCPAAASMCRSRAA